MAWLWLAGGLVGAASAAPPGRAFAYPAEHSGDSALERFRHYAVLEQKVQQRDFVARGFHPSLGTVEAFAAKVNTHARQLCGGLEQAWSLHSAAHDTDGVQHAVLEHTDDGHWQYVALAGDRLLVADPPFCTASAQHQQRRLYDRDHAVDQGDMQYGLEHPAHFRVGSSATLLNPVHDSYVKECVAYFETVAQRRCQKTFQATVHNARLSIIGGLAVKIMATIIEPSTGNQAMHKVECDLLEIKDDNYDPSELAKGFPGKMTYEVAMNIDICDSTSSAKSEPLTQLFEQRAFGELSRYRGYRHVYENVTRLYGKQDLRGARSLASSPASLDLRAQSPQCFPNGVIRHQGTCGSCWAFAAASAFMSNLCMASGDEDGHVLASSWERYEVSAQHIMTCNPQQMGCDGGHATAVRDAFDNHGIARIRDVPYKCGGGDALDHFRVKTEACTGHPWGTGTDQCARTNPHWHFEGLYSLQGMSEMMMALAEGYALYVSMEVNSGFLAYEGGHVFVPDPLDEVEGGHSLACVGYGLHFGQEYWWLQNSWGRQWGERGYIKFGRGNNYLGIEETAMVFRGHTTGQADKMPSVVGTRALTQVQRIMLVAAVVALVIGCFVLKFLCSCCCGGSSQGQRPYMHVQQSGFQNH